MKAILFAALFGLIAPAMSLAQSTGAVKTEPKDFIPDGKPPGQAHRATGQVVKVDFIMDELTIVHEPIPSLSWPVMRMEFRVQDKKMLDQVRPGLKVEFTFVQSGKDYVVTDIK